jgi:sigma-B regulation protein RsbU (phosphoserine phosphatase)
MPLAIGIFMSSRSKPSKKSSLALRLAIYILLGTGVLFFAVFGYNYYCSRNLVLKLAQENAGHLTQSVKHEIQAVVRGVEKLPETLALRLEDQEYSNQGLRGQIKGLLQNNPELFGLCVAFEPYARDGDARYFAPYYYRDQGHLFYNSLGGQGYDYFRWDWYLIPRELGRAVWCDPYYREHGRTVMTTYAVPFYQRVQGQRSIQGVVGADIALDWLKDLVAGISIYEHGYAFLVSKNGRFIVHPNESYIMRQSLFSLARAWKRPKLRRVGREMVNGGQGFIDLQGLGRQGEYLLYYTPLEKIGWSLGVMIPKRELFAGVHALNRELLLFAGLGLGLLLMTVILISRRVTRPISQLSIAARQIAKGNLDARLPMTSSNDEVGQLTASFEHMRQALKEYIANLTETTKAKERFESELNIAHSIQMNFLPKKFPPFPEREEFELYATLIPAREVGGDLYDYFFLDQERLFFSIGDVSDKGVPAALLMAVTKTLVKGIAETTAEPAGVLDRVNHELCQENTSSMFVTYFAAILNIRTGVLSYSNAGHNPPLILGPGPQSGRLKLPSGLVLGGMEGVSYVTLETRLEPGQGLLLYTDGVTEAMDQDRELFSERRLARRAGELSGLGPEGLVQGLMEALREFSGSAPQFDDITMLALSYKGPSGAAVPQESSPGGKTGYGHNF